jgi:uncharacterized protein (DUF433 family)
MVARTYSEDEKMALVPGIVFVDGPSGRRAHVSGAGVDVFEVIKTYRSVGSDRERLAAAYDWLTTVQVQAALTYYRLFPTEIDERLEREAAVWRRRFGEAVS